MDWSDDDDWAEPEVKTKAPDPGLSDPTDLIERTGEWAKVCDREWIESMIDMVTPGEFMRALAFGEYQEYEIIGGKTIKQWIQLYKRAHPGFVQCRGPRRKDAPTSERKTLMTWTSPRTQSASPYQALVCRMGAWREAKDVEWLTAVCNMLPADQVKRALEVGNMGIRDKVGDLNVGQWLVRFGHGALEQTLAAEDERAKVNEAIKGTKRFRSKSFDSRLLYGIIHFDLVDLTAFIKHYELDPGRPIFGTPMLQLVSRHREPAFVNRLEQALRPRPKSTVKMRIVKAHFTWPMPDWDRLFQEQSFDPNQFFEGRRLIVWSRMLQKPEKTLYLYKKGAMVSGHLVVDRPDFSVFEARLEYGWNLEDSIRFFKRVGMRSFDKASVNTFFYHVLNTDFERRMCIEIAHYVLVRSPTEIESGDTYWSWRF